jgi:hypothetical protein
MGKKKSYSKSADGWANFAWRASTGATRRVLKNK